MRYSQLFGKTSRLTPKDEVSANAKLLSRAGFIDKLSAGVYTILPLGFRVLEKIAKVIREEMNNEGGQELTMPVLHPRENWEKTGRWQTLDILYKLEGPEKKEYALGPTHEEVISPLVKTRVQTYKDLPLYLYQIQTKFRAEKRAKSGLLRGREFLMKDLYSFHADEKDLDDYYERMKLAYQRIFNRIGIGQKTHLTFASGGSFSKYSHEFQTVTEGGEDTIFLCQKCGQAVNKEIKSETLSCPGCGQKQFEETKAIEVGNIFKLKTKFSEPFNLSFTDKDGQKKLVQMGCYGIGLGRLMATVVEVCHDQNGIVWPEIISPFAIHLIPVENTPAVAKAAEKVYADLEKEGIDALFDDRVEKSAGEKFMDADLLGITWRLVVSRKTLEQKKVEMKKRSENLARLVTFHDTQKILRKNFA